MCSRLMFFVVGFLVIGLPSTTCPVAADGSVGGPGVTITTIDEMLLPTTGGKRVTAENGQGETGLRIYSG